MLWRLRPSDVEIELHTYTRTMCQKLQEETELGCWIEMADFLLPRMKRGFLNIRSVVLLLLDSPIFFFT